MEFSLAGFAEFLTEEVGVEHAQERALEIGAAMIEKEAKRLIGTYDAGWRQLAAATQAERERLGYPPNEPLLRDGTMRASIGHTIIEPGKLAEIGSNDQVAVWQELGTSTIPARPFLAAAAERMGKDVAVVAGAIVARALAGASIEGEILKLAIEAAEKLKDLGEEVLEAGEHPSDEDHDR